MMKKWVVGVMVAAALVLPAAVRGHGGHIHKIMGTLSGVQEKAVEVKTRDGKTVTVVLDAKTTVTRGKDKLDATALKVGERVSIDATQPKKDAVMTAQSIKLGTAPAVQAAK